MVHRRRVNSTQGFHLAGTPTGLASRVLLAKTTTALMFLLALVRAVLVTLAMRLALSLVVVLALLLCCSLCSRSAAAAPPSTSLPSRITGRWIRSLIHIALYVVSFPAGCGTPTSTRRTCWPHFRTVVRETVALRLES